MNATLILLISFLVAAFVNAVAITGLWAAGHDHNILAPVKHFVEDNLPDWVFKPTIGCYKCMASIWGGVPFLIFELCQGTPIWISIVLSIAYTCLVSGIAIAWQAAVDALERVE